MNSTAELEVQSVEAECGEKIHLFADARNGSQDAAIAVRWCICPSIFEKIKKERLLNPHLLLVVTEGRYEVARKLVPLAQEMEYFYFRAPGVHRIQATILCADKVSDMREFFLGKRASGGYYVELIDDRERDLKKDFGDHYHNFKGWHIGEGEIYVDVAREFFAKKPPKWLYDWGNFWYETEPRDQCQFRRRCMLAFSLQPPVLLVWSAFICFIRLIIAMFLRFGIGMRGVSFTPTYHPFSESTNDVWYHIKVDEKTSVFTNNGKGERKLWFMVLFMPAIMVSLLGVLFILKCLLFPDDSFWWLPVATIGAIVGIIILGYAGILFAWLLGKIFDFLLGEKDSRLHRKELKLRWRGEQKELAILRMYDQTYSPLVCRGVPLKARLDALPKERRTIYLRFMDLKTKVCKPFARY